MLHPQSLLMQTTRRAWETVPVAVQERELLNVATTHHWPFRVLGVAPVPEAPVFLNHWWLVPIADDTSQIPARSLERVRAIYEAGIRPKTFIIAHEAPPHLPAPADAPKVSKIEFWVSQLTDHSETILKVTGTILGTATALLIAAGMSMGLLMVLGLIGAAALVDPCLIAVTEDDVWIEIDSWMV